MQNTKMYTKEEVLSMLSRLYDKKCVKRAVDGATYDAERGYTDNLVEDYTGPIDAEEYLKEWERYAEIQKQKNQD